ncbi:MAG TPA: acyloxyacyl hydrolase [Stellaceae bacterium]|nr:acyloxyacyl hydrolase [Stellaceae bacterium]
MKRIAFAAAAIVTLAITTASGAKAEVAGFITGGLGAFDFLHNYTTAEGRLEFRFAYSLFFWHPLVGTFFTPKGSVYTYGGFRLELPVGKHILILPIATVGDYEKGAGKDLGSHIEFKTGAEIDLVFANGIRVGPAFDHVSNAGIGKKNPGEENLMMMMSVPLGVFVPGP